MSPAGGRSGTVGSRPPGDDPAAYVAEDRRRALAGGGPVDGRVTGSTLFVDVSGFTAMTQSLVAELGEQRASETLAATLDRVFGALIGEVHRWGGSVIYFSGDAITVWIADDDGRTATGCAFALQDVMALVGTSTTPSGTRLVLGVKVAVATGTAHRSLAGDPAIQLIDVLAGSLMDQVAAAEGAATPGEVLVTPAVLPALPAGAAVAERVTPARAALPVVHVVAPWPGVAAERPDGDAEPPPELPDALSRQWLLPPVLDRLRAGHGEFLADLRPAVPVFVRFGGIDPDHDPRAGERLHHFVVAVQRVVDGHGGHVLQLTVGDKGAYLYAVFGSPQAHHDDAARACAAALDIVALEADGVSDISIGIASGVLRSGTYGHRDRRTFCCLGDAVNLAARLMAKAGPGTVLASGAVVSAAGDGLEVGARMQVPLKGRREPAEAYLVTGRGRTGLGPLGGDLPPLLGRDAELSDLVEILHRATAPGGGPSVVGISSDIGGGKSLLLGTALAQLRDTGTPAATGSATARGVEAAYLGWRAVWRDLLDVGGGDSAEDVLEGLRDRLPEPLHPRLPLLGPLLGVPLPDTDLSRSLEGEVRKKSLEQLVVAALGHLATDPLVIAIDDAHALDPLARDLVVAISRSLDDLPVCLVLAYRTDAEPLLGMPVTCDTTELVLGPLSTQDTELLATRMLTTLDGAAPSPDLVRVLAERADGNPLWVRELCRWLHDHADTPERALRDLPDTLHALVLGRLDWLEETPRRTAKVASVVGQRFTGGLVGRGWSGLGSDADVRRALQVLAARGVTSPADLGQDRWRFAHGVVRDVAYESLPVDVRAEVHDGIAAALESGDFGPVERHLDELAHHAWHGRDPVRQRRWLRAAGEAAQAAYDNETALRHLGRLLEVVAEEERGEVHVRIGQVHELQTRWAQARDAYDAARSAAAACGDQVLVGWATTWAAEVSRKQQRYPEAEALLLEAVVIFAEVGEEAGTAQVGHFAGTLSATQGDLAAAREHYERSLEIRERLGDRAGVGALLSNLAVVAEYEGDYDLAHDLGERALVERRAIGDRRAIGISQNNLGMLAALRGDPWTARTRFEEAMALHQEVGDAWMVALAHHNLGNAHRDLAEPPQAHEQYRRALDAYRGFDDDWALATLYEDAALLLAATGSRADAVRLVGAADALHDRIGSPRTPDVATRIDRALGADREADLLGDGRRLVEETDDGDRVEALVAGAGAGLAQS